MKKELRTQFLTRQHMVSKDFEIYYYSDTTLLKVENHAHNYYEFYFFLEGDVSIQIGSDIYPVQFGDIMLIPRTFTTTRSSTVLKFLTGDLSSGSVRNIVIILPRFRRIMYILCTMCRQHTLICTTMTGYPSMQCSPKHFASLRKCSRINSEKKPRFRSPSTI